MYRINSLVNELGYRWENATPTDFGAMALAIVVAAWFISKYSSN